MPNQFLAQFHVKGGHADCIDDTEKVVSPSFLRKSWTRRATIDLWLKAERHAEADIFDAVVEFLKDQRRDVAAEVRKLYDKHPEWAKDKDAAERIVDHVYDAREWDEDLRNAIGPAIARTVIRGYLSTRAVQAGRRRRFGSPTRKSSRIITKQDWADSPLSDEELQEVLSFDLPPSVTRRVYKVVGEVMDKPYWKDVNDVERERMRWSLQEGIEEGKTLRQIAKDIQRDIASDEVRARRIAVTEVTGSLNAGHEIQGMEAEDAGVTIAKYWVSIGDDKVRPTHEDADGQVVEGAEGLFTVGGYETPYPGHADLPAEERINCRCTFFAEPILAEEKARWIRRGKVWIDRDYAELARRERVERLFAVKGGPGSGNFGHAGRPGEVGGSAPSGSSSGADSGRISSLAAKPAARPSQPTAAKPITSPKPARPVSNPDKFTRELKVKPSSQDQDVVYTYQSPTFFQVNSHLRTGTATNPEVAKQIAAKMDETFARAPAMPRDVEVYRGMSLKHFGVSNPKELVGKEIVDSGFTSTSFDRRVADKFASSTEQGVILAIRVPKGTKAIPVNEYAMRLPEHELVLNRGGKYRVVGIRSGPTPVVEVEYIP